MKNDIAENGTQPKPNALPGENLVDGLLGLGLYVIEARVRKLNKELGPWKLVAAFALESNADAYLSQYKSVGYMRLQRPNAQGDSQPLTKD